MKTKSTELEQHFLAGLLKYPQKYHEISSFINHDDFVCSSANKVIFQVMKSMADNQESIDPVLISQRINQLNITFSENIKPFDYLNGLSLRKISESGFIQTAKDLKKTTLVRSITNKIDETKRVIEKLDPSTPASAIISAVDKMYNAELLSISNFSEEPVNIFEDMERVIEDRGENPIEEVGLMGPYERVNSLYGSLLRSGDITVIVARAKAGKALKLSQKVLTPDGWTPIGSIKVGDVVIAPNGDTANVTGWFPHKKKEMYRVHLEDGRTTDCCKEHLWKIYSRDNKGYHVWMVEDTETIAKKHMTRSRRHVYIPTVSFKSDEPYDESLPIHPYLLGFMIGDGSFRSSCVNISSNIGFVYNKISNVLKKYHPDCACSEKNIDKRGNNNYHFRIRKKNLSSNEQNGIYINIKNLGLDGKLSYEKFIPDQYLESNASSKMLLLQGLMDSDGTIGKNGGMVFYTVSEKLAYDVRRVVWSLGGVCKIASRIPKYTDKGEKKEGRTCYNVRLRIPERERVFSVPHKRERAKKPYKYSTNKVRVDRVEKLVEKEDCACITVDSPDCLYVTDDYVVTHNTSMALDYCTKVGARYKIPILHLDNGEMSIENLQMRQCAALSGVPMFYIESGKWRQNKEFVKKVREVWPKIKDMKFDYFNVGGFSVEEMLNLVRRYYFGKIGRGNQMVLSFDYLKFRSQDAKSGDSWYIMGHMLDQFKTLIQKEIIFNNKPQIAMFTSVQANRSGIARNGQTEDNESIVGLSDMIGQLCSHLFLLRRKTLEEISEENNKWGTHKFIPLLNRHLGKESLRATRIIDLGDGRKTENYVSLSIDNFYVTEKGDVIDWMNYINVEDVEPIA